MVPRDLRGKVAIVGVSEADKIGVRPDASVLRLHAEAAKNALADAGLTIKDVDGLFTAGIYSNLLGEYLGITARYTDGTMVGGCSFILFVEHAMLALAAGVINVALITHGESGRSRVGAPPWPGGAMQPTGQYENIWGITGAASMFTHPATRHMHKYGTKLEHFAEVSVATRKWAAMHPMALMKDPITIQDVLNSRWVCWPHTLLMCCLVTDAGGALVLTRADRAKSLKKPPVYVLGTGEATQHNMISQMKDMTWPETFKVSGDAAFNMAGVERKEIQVAELYDAFSFTPMAALEALGFCKPGESGPFVSGQRTAPGGAFPMNTNGGGLSYTHSGMYGMFTVIELVRQLRGECGQRQVKGAKIGIAHGPGGMFSAAGTLIAGSVVP
ncbi:MAG: thiolase [Chloroflexi bacterium]|nr:thiolase [Chloroflexota bacterium]